MLLRSSVGRESIRTSSCFSCSAETPLFGHHLAEKPLCSAEFQLFRQAALQFGRDCLCSAKQQPRLSLFGQATAENYPCSAKILSRLKLQAKFLHFQPKISIFGHSVAEFLGFSAVSATLITFSARRCFWLRIFSAKKSNFV